MRLAGIAALSVAWVAPAWAQNACGPAADIVAGLASEFGESLTGEGMSGGNILQMWASIETGTWTVLVIRPDGLACLAASGTDWHAVAPAALGIDG